MLKISKVWLGPLAKQSLKDTLLSALAEPSKTIRNFVVSLSCLTTHDVAKRNDSGLPPQILKHLLRFWNYLNYARIQLFIKRRWVFL